MSSTVIGGEQREQRFRAKPMSGQGWADGSDRQMSTAKGADRGWQREQDRVRIRIRVRAEGSGMAW